MSEDGNKKPDEGGAAAPPTPPPKPTGPAVIAGYLPLISNGPGVYRMMDIAGEVLYVGKARSLKKRVSSYAREGAHNTRIWRMIHATASMEFMTTRTEAEALLLEANLIKRLKPRFNVLLRDDKSFPYILLRRGHPAAQIQKHRGARNLEGDYFGPFASAGAVNRTINTLQRAFLLRSCTDAVYESRTRPCLLHQIKRCSAPCTGEIGLEDYAKLVEEAAQFLKGESQTVRERLKTMMMAAADKLEFERAAVFRNRLSAISHVTADQNINPDGIEEADVFAAHQDGGITCIEVFFFRTGQNWGNRAYFPRAHSKLPVEEVLDAFIAQFYDDKPVPRLILLSHEIETRELLAEALSAKAERKVTISVPERGDKRGIVTHALDNAREALGRRLAESSSQRRLLAGVAEKFALAHPPRRIEVYDNSHIMGSSAVGAMIVAGPEGFVKNQYRKFNIKSAEITPGDDYAMMREVLTRRFARLVKEVPERGLEHIKNQGSETLDTGLGDTPTTAKHEDAPLTSATGAETIATVLPPPLWGKVGEGGTEVSAQDLASPSLSTSGFPPPHKGEGSSVPPASGASPSSENADGSDDADDANTPAASDLPPWPDLVLIDGGPGQLSVAVAVLKDLGIDTVPLIGVAKGPDRDAGREHFHRPNQRPFMMEPRDPILFYIQRLRDEAHRFAIGTHRAKRKKALGVNPLDEIEGIGPTRKRALLGHFGSAKAVSRAGIEDLKAVAGISAEMAQKIYDFFHEKE